MWKDLVKCTLLICACFASLCLGAIHWRAQSKKQLLVSNVLFLWMWWMQFTVYLDTSALYWKAIVISPLITLAFLPVCLQWPLVIDWFRSIGCCTLIAIACFGHLVKAGSLHANSYFEFAGVLWVFELAAIAIAFGKERRRRFWLGSVTCLVCLWSNCALMRMLPLVGSVLWVSCVLYVFAFGIALRVRAEERVICATKEKSLPPL